MSEAEPIAAHLQYEDAFTGFEESLLDAQYDEYSPTQFAGMFGVTIQTIYKWKKRVDWDYIKSERRKKYAEKTTRVDSAMYKAAAKGDVQAAKLWYERFDNWIPATSLKIDDKKDHELIERAEQLKQSIYGTGIKPDMPGVSPTTTQ